MNEKVIKTWPLSQNTGTVKTFSEIKGSMFNNDENKYFLINSMELIDTGNLQGQEKKRD